MKMHPQVEPSGSLASLLPEPSGDPVSALRDHASGTLACAGALLLMLGCGAIGCGTPGAPQPPSLKLPQPPADLSASRTGDAIALHWTMPRRATDRVLLSGDQRAVICRAVGAAPCTAVAALLLQAGAPAGYTDRLSGGLMVGPPQLLRYTVLLENRHHTGAGPSNVAYTAAGAAPPPVIGLHAEAEARGIALHWQPAPSLPGSGAERYPIEHLLRLHRTRILEPKQGAGPSKGDTEEGVPQPTEQTLELGSAGAGPATASRSPDTLAATSAATSADTMAAGWMRAEAVDSNALLNRTYRYTVERVARVLLDGHPVEVTGGLSAPARVDALDLFPPAVPGGLEAVADATGGAIDLSWTPNTEPDLAGYAVYRRMAGVGTAVRVSGTAPVVDPAWRDAAVARGVRYAYSVSALDTSGNESARSPEAEETMPPAERKAAEPKEPNQPRPPATAPASSAHRSH